MAPRIRIPRIRTPNSRIPNITDNYINQGRNFIERSMRAMNAPRPGQGAISGFERLGFFGGQLMSEIPPWLTIPIGIGAIGLTGYSGYENFIGRPARREERDIQARDTANRASEQKLQLDREAAARAEQANIRAQEEARRRAEQDAFNQKMRLLEAERRNAPSSLSPADMARIASQERIASEDRALREQLEAQRINADMLSANAKLQGDIYTADSTLQGLLARASTDSQIARMGLAPKLATDFAQLDTLAMGNDIDAFARTRAAREDSRSKILAQIADAPADSQGRKMTAAQLLEAARNLRIQDEWAEQNDRTAISNARAYRAMNAENAQRGLQSSINLMGYNSQNLAPNTGIFPESASRAIIGKNNVPSTRAEKLLAQAIRGNRAGQSASFQVPESNILSLLEYSRSRNPFRR